MEGNDSSTSSLPIQRHPIRLGRFWRRSLAVALGETFSFFGWNARTLIVASLSLLTGSSLHASVKGVDAMKEELLLWLIYAFAPMGAFAFLLAIWNAVRAPAVLYYSKVSIIEDLNARITDLETKIRPKLVLSEIIESVEEERSESLLLRNFIIYVENAGAMTIEDCKLEASITEEGRNQPIRFFSPGRWSWQDKKLVHAPKENREFTLRPGQSKRAMTISMNERSSPESIAKKDEGSRIRIWTADDDLPVALERTKSYFVAISVFGGPSPARARYHVFVDGIGRLVVRMA